MMSRPVAARASRKRSSAVARRMPRLRWARMVERLAVPKHAAMIGNVWAPVRCRTVAMTTAVAEHDANGVEHDADVLGHGARLILGRVGR